MKRIRKRSILALMVVLTLCLSLVSAYATPYQMPVPESSGIIFDGTSGHDIQVKGVLSLNSPNKTYTFTLRENGYVQITNPHNNEIPIMILDDEGYVLGSATLEGPEMYNSYRLYLMAGTYELFVGTEHPTGIPGPIVFSLMAYFADAYEDYPESPTKNNDIPKNADPLILEKTHIGILCANEACVMKPTESSPATDFYKFEVLTENDEEHEMQISMYYTCPIQVYILKSDGNIVAHRFENLTIPAGNNFSSLFESFYLDDGIYYLGVEALGEATSGYYNVRLRDLTRAYDYNYDIHYTTVGESVQIFNKFDPQPIVVTDHWESFRPEIAEIRKENGMNVLRGYKVGRTQIYGYPDTSGFSNCRVKLTGMVEFTDVRRYEDVYYYEPVYWAADNGITMGIMDKDGVYRSFGPQKNCTRAQIVTFLWRMEGCPEPETYTSYYDVKTTDYFYKAVCWAQENEITKGYPDGTFKPQNVCSRSQVVTFLWRLAGEPEPENPGSFPDVQDPETYFYEAVSWAAENQITEGYPDGTFKPAKNCTRAQTVTFLYRYDDKFRPKG